MDERSDGMDGKGKKSLGNQKYLISKDPTLLFTSSDLVLVLLWFGWWCGGMLGYYLVLID
jgi:hypothetical protein